MLNEKHHIEQLIAGSYKDFSILYEHYWPHLYTYTFGLIQNKMLAEDIVQEIFIKIWTRRELINVELSFKSFLFTIAHNSIYSEFRKQVSSPQFSDFVEYTNSISLSENNVDKKINFDDFMHSFEKAKANLSPRLLEIYNLNKEVGLSIPEIVVKLGIGEQTVRNQLTKAMKQIRFSLIESPKCI